MFIIHIDLLCIKIRNRSRKEDRDLPSDDSGTADFIVKISKGVHLLHSMGYAHRDIKPGNIMYRHDGTPVLLDMGLLKRLDSGNVIVGNDSALSVVDGKAVGVGTPRYAAPEQYGFTQTDGRADIYALGVLFNEMLTKQHPSKYLNIGDGKRRPS